MAQQADQNNQVYTEYRQTVDALHAEQARLERAGKPASATWHKHNKRAAQLAKKVPWWKR
jgi:hypothetical protein